MRAVLVVVGVSLASGCDRSRAETGSGPGGRAASASPESKQPAEPAPPRALADQAQVESLLNQYHQRFCEGFNLVSHGVVAKGDKGGLGAQLIAYKATAQCFGRLMKLCGKIALSFDPEWKTYRFVSGFNFMPGQGMDDEGGCDDVGRLPVHCFGCGNKKLIDAITTSGFRFPGVEPKQQAPKPKTTTR